MNERIKLRKNDNFIGMFLNEEERVEEERIKLRENEINEPVEEVKFETYDEPKKEIKKAEWRTNLAEEGEREPQVA